MESWYALLPTLAGPLLAVAGRDGLRHLHILPEADAAASTLARLVRADASRAAAGRADAGRADAVRADAGHPPMVAQDAHRFKDLAAQLGEYFVGRRQRFELALAPRGTEFQRRVWTQLRAIAHGDLRSYSQLAADLGCPGAARAVGQAAAQNPLPILIPCHRLLGTDGSLVGFAGGNDLKARLLRLEGHTLAAGERIRPPQLF